MGKVPAAVEQYTSLLLQHPNYIDAFVRLAACERVAGRLQGAEAWLKKVRGGLWGKGGEKTIRGSINVMGDSLPLILPTHPTPTIPPGG